MYSSLESISFTDFIRERAKEVGVSLEAVDEAAPYVYVKLLELDKDTILAVHNEYTFFQMERDGRLKPEYNPGRD